jgi:hypothetical protein
MLQKLLFAIVFLFGIQANYFAQDGKLDKGKESLKTTNTSSISGKTTSKASNNRRNTRNNDLENPFARIIWSIAAYTFYGVVIESPFEIDSKMHDAEIAHYPYELAYQGNFIYTDSTNYNITRVDVLNTFVIENKNLYGNNLDVNFRFLKRFALGVDYLYLTEKVEDNRDSFALYSALLKYHRIRTQRFDAWFGLGIMYVGSNVDKSGFGMGVGAQWFVKKPISLNFSHKWTNINQQEVHKTKLLLNYHIKNYQISSGYEHFKIGVSKIGAFSLGVGASF